MHRERVEQLVRDQDAFERFRQCRAGRGEPIADLAERRRLSGTRRGARFDEMKMDRAVEIGMLRLRRPQDVG